LKSSDALVDFFDGIKVAESKTYRSLWHCMQGLMRHRGTVESDPCHNSIILFQSKCNLCIVIVREIKRDDSKPVLKGLPSHNMCLWNFTYFFKKMSGQCHFLLMDCGNPGFVQISEGSVKSDDAREI